MRFSKRLRGERARLIFPILFITLFITTILTYFETSPPNISESSILEAADANRVPAPDPDNLQSRLQPSSNIPQRCGHIVLFTSARHGSTWFIDSVEGCRYSKTRKSSDELYSNSIFKFIEPWKHNRSSLYRVSGSQVADYVLNNSSIKIFSSTLDFNLTGVEELVREGTKLGIPFVVLRRQPEATFRSLRIALETGVWNAPTRETHDTREKDIGNVDVETEKFMRYKQGIDKYYAKVDDILRGGGVRDVDTLDYDEIKGLKYIKLERNGCYVRNCNFAD